MQTIEQRVRDHALASGMLAEGRDMSSYAAEAAAWVANACAEALTLGADLRDVAQEICTTLRQAGASAAEQSFAQFVLAEIEALVHRIGPSEGDLSLAVLQRFRWTEKPQLNSGIRYRLRIMNVPEMDDVERRQVRSIYAVAMLRHFANLSLAFRAWSDFASGVTGSQAAAWQQHHQRAQHLAFAGLGVGGAAAVSVSFRLLR